MNALVLVAALALGAAGAAQAGPAALPPGFEDQLVIDNFGGLSQFAIAPDGLIYAASKSGYVYKVENGSRSLVLTLAADYVSERGVNGMAVDPDYLTNGHVWIFYADLATTRNRVSRFTWNGTTLANEAVMLEGPVMLNGDHSGGCIRFASDKTLYIAMGDDRQDEVTAQDPYNLPGSILRIDRDGNAPADNPFVDGIDGDPRVWAYGLRNPFRISIQPDTDNVFIADVGLYSTEEVSIGIPGGNFGWPAVEGADPPGLPGYVYPIHTVPHNGGGSAIIGGDFAEAGDLAPEFEGNYFFSDYVTGILYRMELDPSNTVLAVEEWGTGLIQPSDIQFGPDGALYYASRSLTGLSTGELRKIVHVGVENRQPDAQVAVTPDSGPAPLGVILDGTGSTDPDEDPLEYDWVLGDGGTADTAMVSHTYSQGVYEAELTVDDGRGGVSSSGPIRIVSGNNRPTASISAPADGANYNAGETFQFSATASDVEDASIPCSSFSWKVIFHHNVHTHPYLGPIAGVCDGSFDIPTEGETSADVWYRVELTVDDSGAPLGAEGVLSDTESVEIFPNRSTMTFETSPRPDLALTLDGVPIAGGESVLGVVGLTRTIGAVSGQVAPDGHTYTFESWSDGGAQSHAISTPAQDTTFTAGFTCNVKDPVQNLRIELDDGTGDLTFTWDALDPTCRSGYRIYGAVTPRPSSGAGQFPVDPSWTLLGSPTDPGFQDAATGYGYFLVVGEGTDGADGPVGHYPAP